MRVRRRDDGRLGRARVHGAVPGGRERRRAGARLRGQHRGRERRSAAGGADRPRRRPAHARGDDDRRRGRRPRRPAPATCSRPIPVVTESRGLVMVFVRGDHRVNDIKLANALGESFRPAARGRAAGPRRLPGPDARRPDALRRRDRARPGLRGRRQPRPTTTTWSRVDGGERGDVRTRRGRATPSTATRSASSRRSRSATSSSSARATPSRSARPTSTRTARSS